MHNYPYTPEAYNLEKQSGSLRAGSAELELETDEVTQT